jgi:phosphoglycolate phosphatase-like HAD superfamily hydrolase
MILQKIEEGVYAQDGILEEIKEIDGIVFDCDGVLVDITNSYDLAIQRTTSFILKEIVNLHEFDPVTSKIIDGFKATGGFNDEVDLTYAAIISLAAANALNKNGNQFIFDVIKNADQTGIKSVEKFLENLKVDLSELKKKLDYPGRHEENFLYSTFDQIFYGPELYKKLFNKNSTFTDDGLIENDIVLIKKELLDKLKNKFSNKIAIVSGRGIESIRYSLKELLHEFNVEKSVFLEDESRELAKPNPNSIIRTFKGIGAAHCLFVGDSMEDLIMAKKATDMGNKITFCGIIGTSKFPDEKRKLFEKHKAPLIVNSIDLLPKVLNLV